MKRLIITAALCLSALASFSQGFKPNLFTTNNQPVQSGIVNPIGLDNANHPVQITNAITFYSVTNVVGGAALIYTTNISSPWNVSLWLNTNGLGGGGSAGSVITTGMVIQTFSGSVIQPTNNNTLLVPIIGNSFQAFIPVQGPAGVMLAPDGGFISNVVYSVANPMGGSTNLLLQVATNGVGIGSSQLFLTSLPLSTNTGTATFNLPTGTTNTWAMFISVGGTLKSNNVVMWKFDWWHPVYSVGAGSGGGGGSGGTATNSTALNGVNATNVLNSIVVVVATNGWSSPGTWHVETNPGQSLQDAINFYSTTNGLWTNIDSVLTYTNPFGYDFTLGPAPYNNPFYLPQGFSINNSNNPAFWHFHGLGLNTIICGNSNVFTCLMQAVNTYGPNVEIDHLVFAVSNYQSKAVAVNLQGNQFVNFHDNYIYPWVAFLPPIFAVNGGQGVIGVTGYCPGFIGLTLSGSTAPSYVWQNRFLGAAVDVLSLDEHQRFHDNEFFGWGDGSVPTNQWATNDSTFVIGGSGSGGLIFGSDLALGAGLVFCGVGDISSIGDKWLGTLAGIYVKGVFPQYGPILLKNDHFESIGVGQQSRDILAANDSDEATAPSMVVTEDCWDQQNNNSPMITAWCFDTSSHVISTNFTSANGDTNFITSIGVEASPTDPSGIGETPRFTYRVNNTVVYDVDFGISTFELLQGWKYKGNASGFTNLPSPTISANPNNQFVNGIAYSNTAPGTLQGVFQVTSTVGAGASMKFVYTNGGVIYNYPPIVVPLGNATVWSFPFAVRLPAPSFFSFNNVSGTAFPTNTVFVQDK